MSICKRCSSDRLMGISAKTSDRLNLSVGAVGYRGYTPPTPVLLGGDFSPGFEDYVVLTVCLNCGQLQGDFPAAPVPGLENAS